MTGRVQTLRSSVAGNRPTGRQPGELYVNWADNQLGVINASSTPQDLIAVRFFSTLSAYNTGDYVIQAGQLYAAKGAVAAGAFNPTQWLLAGGSVVIGDTPPASPNVGMLWFDSVGGQLYVWYADANSSQWVPAINTQGPQGATGPQGVPGPQGAAGPQGPTGAGVGENRIINGDMRNDQRNGGASGTAQGYTLDRWNYVNASAPTSRGAWQRGGPAGSGALTALGFGYWLAFASSSAYAAAATDQFCFYQPIEADMVSDFAWGTANAQPVTLSFWVTCSLAGTFGGSLRNFPTNNRSYPFSFNIPVATTWTKIAVTIPGDTTGTWAMNGNGGGMSLTFDLGSGANFRGPANAWASASYAGVTGAVSIVGTNGASFNLTGVKLEIGSVATPFNRPTLAKALADCQRYYQAFNALGNCAWAGSAGQGFWTAFTLMASMRAVPTMTVAGSGFSNCSTPSITPQSGSSFYVTALATATGGATFAAAVTANAEL
jgi:hypothetical protein